MHWIVSWDVKLIERKEFISVRGIYHTVEDALDRVRELVRDSDQYYDVEYTIERFPTPTKRDVFITYDRYGRWRGEGWSGEGPTAEDLGLHRNIVIGEEIPLLQNDRAREETL